MNKTFSTYQRGILKSEKAFQKLNSIARKRGLKNSYFHPKVSVSSNQFNTQVSNSRSLNLQTFIEYCEALDLEPWEILKSACS